MGLRMQIYMNLAGSCAELVNNHEILPKRPQKMAGKGPISAFWGENAPKFNYPKASF
jgi:hypothetical protein